MINSSIPAEDGWQMSSTDILDSREKNKLEDDALVKRSMNWC